MRTEKLVIPSRSSETPIHVGTGILDRLTDIASLNRYSAATIVTDTGVPTSIIERVQRGIRIPCSLVILPSGELAKSITSAQEIWQHLSENRRDRSSVVVNVGGGLISDIGGFAASTYMRGIDWINVPTTLLAQVDAAIGGKTGVNVHGVKNLIGTFGQPSAVIIDVDTLASLPRRELVSGFGEIIKHGIMRDPIYFADVTAKKPEEYSERELVNIIGGSVRIKSDIVSRDPYETGVRKALNFGHTIGHAVESLSHETGTPLTHGEAVSIGIAVESAISEKIGLLGISDRDTIIRALAHAGLPTKLPDIHIDRIKARLLTDKKNKNGEILWVLPTRIGHVRTDVKVHGGIIDDALGEARV